MTTFSVFPKIRAFFHISENGKGSPPSSALSSYAVAKYGSDNHKTLPFLILKFQIQVIYHWLILLLELNQTSKMKFFVKIANGSKPLTISTKGSILDVWLGSKYVSAVYEAFLSLYARDHLFSRYATFTVKLTLFTPWYAHVRVRIRK